MRNLWPEEEKMIKDIRNIFWTKRRTKYHCK